MITEYDANTEMESSFLSNLFIQKLKQSKKQNTTVAQITASFTKEKKPFTIEIIKKKKLNREVDAKTKM
ncbi:hypothetical protein DERP_008204 [Dermatophagoides pteronyssinus]|uniref:Uncharacterized protein n=1 Tax=Dermatophagoides pteronyssinus TaxID=6956 RepID=A0ABQ8JKG8_DERPT|nr:hypothetical protein DERP_008204 [Dermatophagoides pteronyssinus]